MINLFFYRENPRTVLNLHSDRTEKFAYGWTMIIKVTPKWRISRKFRAAGFEISVRVWRLTHDSVLARTRSRRKGPTLGPYRIMRRRGSAIRNNEAGIIKIKKKNTQLPVGQTRADSSRPTRLTPCLSLPVRSESHRLSIKARFINSQSYTKVEHRKIEQRAKHDGKSFKWKR